MNLDTLLLSLLSYPETPHNIELCKISKRPIAYSRQPGRNGNNQYVPLQKLNDVSLCSVVSGQSTLLQTALVTHRRGSTASPSKCSSESDTIYPTKKT